MQFGMKLLKQTKLKLAGTLSSKLGLRSDQFKKMQQLCRKERSEAKTPTEIKMISDLLNVTLKENEGMSCHL